MHFRNKKVRFIKIYLLKRYVENILQNRVVLKREWKITAIAMKISQNFGHRFLAGWTKIGQILVPKQNL